MREAVITDQDRIYANYMLIVGVPRITSGISHISKRLNSYNLLRLLFFPLSWCRDSISINCVTHGLPLPYRSHSVQHSAVDPCLALDPLSATVPSVHRSTVWRRCVVPSLIRRCDCELCSASYRHTLCAPAALMAVFMDLLCYRQRPSPLKASVMKKTLYV